jgi:hypothetical protein
MSTPPPRRRGTAPGAHRRITVTGPPKGAPDLDLIAQALLLLSREARPTTAQPRRRPIRATTHPKPRGKR